MLKQELESRLALAILAAIVLCLLAVAALGGGE